uniref:Uncharacterized protein n=1 Tax=Cryptomonas curvata TaxID=233186 RepID=A0A7S0M115_9CRYP|mmetsp:Transcript_19393/g.40752  ORF Transcript_19393/g.40752 Transcript_19393/m.40752 type:complete len:165 (+) Transcript_19393:15-509(+)
MAAPNDSAGQSSVLDCFHQSALRHFERAHMIAHDLDMSQSCAVAAQPANDMNERCKQWVLDESGQCPREVASWDGSVNYDSHEGNGPLESCSAYAGLLDSCISPVSGPFFMIPTKTVESWTSSRSISMCHAQTNVKPELPTDLSAAPCSEAPRPLTSPKAKLEL